MEPTVATAADFFKIVISAFLGSGFAFLANALHERGKQRQADFCNGIEAQFALVRQREILYVVRKHSLNSDGMREHPYRHLVLKPYSYYLPQYPTIGSTRLGYMLDKQNPNLLHELVVIESQFIVAIETLRDRNKFHTQMQEEVARTGSIRQDIDAILRAQTDQLYEMVDGVIPEIDRLMPIFGEYLRNRFCWPWGRQPLAYIPPNSDANEPPPSRA